MSSTQRNSLDRITSLGGGVGLLHVVPPRVFVLDLSFYPTLAAPGAGKRLLELALVCVVGRDVS